MSKSKDFIRVDDWEPEEKDRIVVDDGRVVVIPFHEIFGRRKYEKMLNEFLIKKVSYSIRLDHYTHYINYFIKFYDPNNELLLSYVKLKYLIINKNIPLNKKSFIDNLYGIMFTDSMKEKIRRMVEDNYWKSLKFDEEGKYPDFLEFNDHHAKIMMEISVAMKLMLPVMMHYVISYGVLKDSEYPAYPLFPFYYPLFDLFGDGVDIYNKLYETVRNRVVKNANDSKTIWRQREIEGIDPIIKIDELLRKDIICETMPKYEFDKNIIFFNSVVLRTQLSYFLKEKYRYTHIKVDNNKDSEGLSGLDKLEMNTAKIDESLIILSNVNTKEVIKRIRKSMNITISDDEIDFYRENVTISKFQVQLVFYFYARVFGGYRDLQLLTKKQYIHLLVLLKKRLQYQGMVYLPQIITADIKLMRTRLIQNQKFLTKIGNSDVYKSIINDKYTTLEEIGKPHLIEGLLSTILNTKFNAVDYNNPDRLGDELEIGNPDILSDEVLAFVNQI